MTSWLLAFSLQHPSSLTHAFHSKIEVAKDEHLRTVGDANWNLFCSLVSFILGWPSTHHVAESNFELIIILSHQCALEWACTYVCACVWMCDGSAMSWFATLFLLSALHWVSSCWPLEIDHGNSVTTQERAASWLPASHLPHAGSPFPQFSLGVSHTPSKYPLLYPKGSDYDNEETLSLKSFSKQSGRRYYLSKETFQRS